MNLNRIILIGRLTADPEQRFSNDGMEIGKFRLAVSRPVRAEGRDNDKPDADFFNVTCFRNSAKFVNAYMRRGNLVAVEGRLEIDQYTDREGAKQTWVQVLADNVQSLQTRAESEAHGGEREPRQESRRPDQSTQNARPRAVDDEPFGDGPPPARGGSSRPPARPAGGPWGDDDGTDPFAEE